MLKTKWCKNYNINTGSGMGCEALFSVLSSKSKCLSEEQLENIAEE
jgi:hypothetical protein